ncbi:MAG: hypothetical protein HOW73_34890 [Polyangiaceae bacterium]|nr:hypothetical protein [Polyangiaceae bacterium]
MNHPSTLRHGTWNYGGSPIGHTWLIKQDWDYYDEDFYDDPPDLGPDGFAYYLLTGLSPHIEQHSARSRTFLTEAEAADYAATNLPGLTWDPHHERSDPNRSIAQPSPAKTCTRLQPR